MNSCEPPTTSEVHTDEKGRIYRWHAVGQADHLDGMAPELKEAVEEFLQKNKVVLFMKGTKQFPQCGFSNTCVQVLATLQYRPSKIFIVLYRYSREFKSRGAHCKVCPIFVSRCLVPLQHDPFKESRVPHKHSREYTIKAIATAGVLQFMRSCAWYPPAPPVEGI
jgi:hypothetical protein